MGSPLSSLCCHSKYNIGIAIAVLGEWVNPHRERQTIPQGQTSRPPQSFLTPTAKARPNQAAIATAAETHGTTHRARPRSPFFAAADEKRPTEKFANIV